MLNFSFARKRVILFALCPFLLCAYIVPGRLMAQAQPKEAVSADLLVRGATIVTMDPDRHVIDNGYIAVRGDQIIAIGENPASEFPKGLTAKQTIDAKGKLIIPGLINGHTHIPMVLLRGLVDDVTLDDWLRNIFSPPKQRTLPKILSVGARASL